MSTLLTSNDSNTSLPPTAPGANGKQGIAGKRPSDVVDPLEVLNGIISKRKADKPGATLSNRDSAPAVKPPRLVDTIDFGELSLEEFIEKEDKREPRRILNSDAGAQTIEQFEKESDKFQDLHSAITGCDDVSKSVEMYLSDFQTELGAVSAEIETLQTRSVQLNSMLANRRNVEQLLGPSVEEISISPKAVRLIAEGPIDDNWVKSLNEIETRTASIEAKASSSSNTKSIDDVRPLLSELKNKVSVLQLEGARASQDLHPSCRRLKELGTILFPRSGRCGHRISTPKFSSSSAWSGSRNFTATCHEPIRHLPERSPRHILTRCGGITCQISIAIFKHLTRSSYTLVIETRF